MTRDDVQDAVIDSIRGTRGTNAGTLAQVIECAWTLAGATPFDTEEKIGMVADLLAGISMKSSAVPDLVYALRSYEIREALEPFFPIKETGE